VKKKKKNPLRKGVKSIFLTGIITILPLGLTIFVVVFLVRILGNFAGKALKYIPGFATLPDYALTTIGFFAFIIIIFIVGLITSSFVGKYVIRLTDKFFSKLPFVKSVYTSARQLTDTLFVDRSSLKRVIIIEYPRKGLYTMAFVTNDDKWVVNKEKNCVNVFVPTSPNPTSGYYIMVPEDEIIQTDLSIEWGFKIIVSGGIILPDDRRIDAGHS
jgi:uncharacterized membrane protein